MDEKMFIFIKKGSEMKLNHNIYIFSFRENISFFCCFKESPEYSVSLPGLCVGLFVRRTRTLAQEQDLLLRFHLTRGRHTKEAPYYFSTQFSSGKLSIINLSLEPYTAHTIYQTPALSVSSETARTLISSD